MWTIAHLFNRCACSIICLIKIVNVPFLVPAKRDKGMSKQAKKETYHMNDPTKYPHLWNQKIPFLQTVHWNIKFYSQASSWPDIGCKERPVRFNIQAGPVFIFSATVVKEVWLAVKFRQTNLSASPGFCLPCRISLYPSNPFPAKRFLWGPVSFFNLSRNKRTAAIAVRGSRFASISASRCMLSWRIGRGFLAKWYGITADYFLFWDQPALLSNAYEKLKVLELLLHLSRFPLHKRQHLSAYPSEQVVLVQKIHYDLLQKLDQRITIDTLAQTISHKSDDFKKRI